MCRRRPALGGSEPTLMPQQFARAKPPMFRWPDLSTKAMSCSGAQRLFPVQAEKGKGHARRPGCTTRDDDVKSVLNKACSFTLPHLDRERNGRLFQLHAQMACDHDQSSYRREQSHKEKPTASLVSTMPFSQVEMRSRSSLRCLLEKR